MPHKSVIKRPVALDTRLRGYDGVGFYFKEIIKINYDALLKKYKTTNLNLTPT